MKLFGLTIRREGAHIRIIRGPELLEEKELTAAFGVGLEHPVLRGVLQLIDTAEDNANRAAAADPENREAYVGGAEQLRTLMDDIFIRQGNALKMLEAAGELRKPDTGLRKGEG